MTKPTIANAQSVTVDEVTSLARLFNSRELRGIQTKLTSTLTELRNLAHGRQQGGGLVANIGALLSPEQRDQLLEAAKVVETVGSAVTHAKEKRVRSEKDTKKRQEARLARAKQLVAAAYPLPCETNVQRLDVIKSALIHNRAKQYQPNTNPLEFNHRVRGFLAEPSRLQGCTLRVYRVNTVTSIRYGLLDEVITELAYDDGSTVEERLQVLQMKVADTVAQASLTADEQETLRRWKEVFPPAAELQEDQA